MNNSELALIIHSPDRSNCFVFSWIPDEIATIFLANISIARTPKIVLFTIFMNINDLFKILMSFPFNRICT